MLTFDELWRQLCALNESVQIEAKTGSRIGPSILETISAFCNEPGQGGGYLLLGVRPIETSAPPHYEIVGVSEPDRLQAELASMCSGQFSIVVRPRISVEMRDGKRVLIAFIPEANPVDKPVFVTSRGLSRGAFRRIGSTDQRLTDDDVHLLYQVRSTSAVEDTPILGSIGDFDTRALESYRIARGRSNPTAAELLHSDADLLRSLGVVTGPPGDLSPTMAGLVLFGTRAAIRRALPAMRVDYIRVAGREWVRSPDERFDSLDILGPLMLAIPRAMSAVLDDIPKSFRLPGNTNQREDVPLIPQTALREAVVNALMHRSYRQHQPVQIIRYSNRVEIRNPGVSLVPDELLGEPGSRQRNPRIAAVLHDAGFAETKGSGIRAIREAMARAGLSPPTFESDRERDTFVVTFLFHHFLSGEDIEWLGRFRRLALTEAEQRALVFVREVGAINIAAYRDLNRVETSVAAAELRRLKDAGLLDLHGKGATMHYRPTELHMAPAGSAASENKSSFAPGGVQPTELTPNLHGLPTELAPNLHGLPTELDTAVRSLGQRATSEQIRLVIECLCRWRPQTSDQLAQLLGRNKHHLVTSILRPMVKDGRLSLTHPEAPAHPQQAYTARPPGP